MPASSVCHPPHLQGDPVCRLCQTAGVSSLLQTARGLRLLSSHPTLRLRTFMSLNDANNLEAGRAPGLNDASKKGTPDIRVEPGTPLEHSTEAPGRPASRQSNRYMGGLVPPSESGARRLRQAATTSGADSEIGAEKPASSAIRQVADGENALSLRHKPSVAFTATSGVAPQTFRDLAVLYQVVAEVSLGQLPASKARSLT